MRPSIFEDDKVRCMEIADDLGHVMGEWRNVEAEDEPPQVNAVCLVCGAVVQILSDPRAIGGGAIMNSCE